MMRTQGLVLFGLALLAALSMAGGYPLPAMLLMPAPVAYLWTRGRFFPAVLMVGSLGAIPIFLSGAYFFGSILVLMGVTGILLGIMMRRQVSVGPAVAVVTVLIFGIAAGRTALTWQESRAEWHSALEAYKSQFKDVESSESIDSTLNLLTWFDENWLYISFGMLFGLVALATVAVVGTLYRTLALQGLINPPNWRFSRMRVPEHGVWLAIALAGLWFLDDWRPNEIVRCVAWNGAIAMAIVYWINGLSIAVCAVVAFQMKLAWVLLVFVAAFVFNFHQMLALIGLFDTWWDFRLKVRQMAEARQKSD